MGAIVEVRDKKLPGGVVLTDTGQKVNILDRKEDNYWDTVIMAAAAITANTQVDFFKTVSTKGLHYSVFTNDNRIVGNEQILVTKLGIQPLVYYGNTRVGIADMMKVAHSCYAEFKKNDNVKKRGPMMYWQSGYAIAGMTTETDQTYLSNGVPSPAAIPDVLKPFELNDEAEIICFLRFPTCTMLMSDGNACVYIMPTLVCKVPVMLTMHGFIVRSGLRD